MSAKNTTSIVFNAKLQIAGGFEDNVSYSLKKTYFPKFINTFALRKAKIIYNFGLSECNRVKTVMQRWF